MCPGCLLSPALDRTLWVVSGRVFVLVCCEEKKGLPSAAAEPHRAGDPPQASLQRFTRLEVDPIVKPFMLRSPSTPTATCYRIPRNCQAANPPLPSILPKPQTHAGSPGQLTIRRVCGGDPGRPTAFASSITARRRGSSW